MENNFIKPSDSFRKQAVYALMAIALFALSYLFLLVVSLILTIVCILLGAQIVIASPSIYTIIIGLGLASFGVLILIFQVKFLFSKNKTDLSHLIEIKEQQHPALFAMIRDIVEKVGTSFPKRVFLASNVNASVFYDSSFWSMFLPVKKNLTIGVGLVNTVTASELKAILAHEFGHFSQRSMKVGSYVYNVNNVIYNMLYENDGFDRMIIRWGEATAFFAIVVKLAIKIIQGIQWLLQKIYKIVNIRYMALSREMEFHADQVAAFVTGHTPLKTSLTRMYLADFAFNDVLNFYGNKIKENYKSRNVYREQNFVMQYLAKKDKLNFVNGLPEITTEFMGRYNKSRLVYEDQWASHPSTEERIKRLEALHFPDVTADNQPASKLFTDFDKVQADLTNFLFSNVAYASSPKDYEVERFEQEYRDMEIKNSFPDLFKGYFDSRNPNTFNPSEIANSETDKTMEDLFSDGVIEMVYFSTSLENDINTLKAIERGELDVDTFDYNGKKYKKKQIPQLVLDLEKELDAIQEKLKANDLDIYLYFKKLGKVQGQEEMVVSVYQDFYDKDADFKEKLEFIQNISQQLAFTGVTTPFEIILNNFKALEPFEEKMKSHLSELLGEPLLNNEIDAQMRENIEKYISQKKWIYFAGSNYLDSNLELLTNVIDHYYFLIFRTYFLRKRELLEMCQRLKSLGT